jgi:type IV pilus assembly protein PilY1
MDTMALFRQRFLQATLAAAALAAPAAHSAPPLSIPPDPLGTSTTSVQPNIMMLLDDSGSMLWDFMPDYVGEPGHLGSPPGATGACAADGTISGTPPNTTSTLSNTAVTCGQGDPPFSSPDFNTIYYNPAISYRPGVDKTPDVNGSWVDMPTQNAANTINWTKVKSDPYLSASSTTNLATGYLDRVWCNTPGNSTTPVDVASGNCRQNSAYVFPNAPFPIGHDFNNKLLTIGGAPYYYRMSSAQYCASSTSTNCASGSSIVPATHTVLSVEKCKDADLTICAAGGNVTPAHKFSGPRWCTDAATLVNCQRVKTGAFVNAKHLGRVQTITCSSTPALCAAVSNEGGLTVTGVNTAGLAGDVTITVNGVAVTSAPVHFDAGSSPGLVAGKIADAINAFVSAPDYTASASGNNVNITQVVAGTAGNGNAVAVSANSVGTKASIGAIKVDANSLNPTLSTLSVAGTNLLCKPVVDMDYGNGVRALVADNGAIKSTNPPNLGTNSPAAQQSWRNALIDRINTCAQTIPPGYKVTASDASPYVLLTAPVSMGSTPNGHIVAKGGSNLTAITPVNMGGTAPGQLGTSVITATFGSPTQSMFGGRDAVTGTIPRRIGVGEFSRVDIVPAVDSYPKVPGANRPDCAGTNCTFAEEMTNFANWYAYHRTRINMAKSAVGIAFRSTGDSYRVGFITICPISGFCDKNATSPNTSPVVAAKYLRIATFDNPQKQAWYTKLYSQNPNAFSSTPLREGLSRVGQLYAGQFNTNLTTGILAADEPMTASCQPNFTILATDGYWNGFTGQKIDGKVMDNQDYDARTDKNGVPLDPWTSVATGTYDGPANTTFNDGKTAPSNGSTLAFGTLADVAMYYYKTDLRTGTSPFATDNVRTTAKDKASHQHMVTFTIGLGLDGVLHYQRDYETAQSGDFYNIKQGTASWPVPAADAPSALDDLWHAAVNGRGTFFSARNPAELSDALSDTLNELLGDDGAGAAAATSNLQPVSGDNFAFIASYHTQAWFGELSARTIDLTTLNVSNNPLWSAKNLLDATPWYSRVIYTFDPGDTAGNKLKHFCAPLDGGANCTDGAGLDSATELPWFDPKKLSQSAGWPAAPSAQWTNATPKSLVDYVRGDASNEDTGGGGAQDLYRSRVSKLGDLVNAQPSYVRKATFNYSDKGYPEFKACTAGTGTGCNLAQFPNPSIPRRGTVYAAGNDGMLHAFETDRNNNAYFQTAGIPTPALTDDTFTGNNTGNGVERWAYVPRLVMENLTLLADKKNVHHYYADGSPRAFDICISTPCAGQDDWRTILVAGVNSGGSSGGVGSLGYYALDITNPLAPKGMWELTNNGKCYTDLEISAQDKTSDCHIGLTYGLPVVTKLEIKISGKLVGKWVVLVTSGYNNTYRGGDGRGYLYILDAVTGVILNRVTTGSGSVAAPSGLAKISAWADDASTDNTTLAVYAGDLDGNLWRFALDSSPITTAIPVTLVAALKDSKLNPQPITVTPELTTVKGARVVVLGTGKFIEATDRVPPFTPQTIYALRDDGAVTGPGPVIPDVRNASDVVVRTLVPSATASDERTVTAATAPDWTTQHGWLVDLPDPGERVNIDPIVQLGFVSIPSNVPTSGDTCSAGGYSWFNFFDVTTGSYVPAPNNTMASKRVSDALLVGQSFVCGPGGNCGVIAIDNKGRPRVDPPPLSPQAFSGKRVSWRELLGDQ